MFLECGVRVYICLVTCMPECWPDSYYRGYICCVQTPQLGGLRNPPDEYFNESSLGPTPWFTLLIFFTGPLTLAGALALTGGLV